MVKCEHINECKDAGTYLCGNCKHNVSRSYYEPDTIPQPYVPMYPSPWRM